MPAAIGRHGGNDTGKENVRPETNNQTDIKDARNFQSRFEKRGRQHELRDRRA